MIESEQSVLGVRIRLQLDRFEDGWGWRAWEQCVAGAWRPLPAPAPENRRRRFRTPQSAQEFFYLLAEFIAETATEYISSDRVVPRRTVRARP
jgi:hypothetical protein